MCLYCLLQFCTITYSARCLYDQQNDQQLFLVISRDPIAVTLWVRCRNFPGVRTMWSPSCITNTIPVLDELRGSTGLLAISTHVVNTVTSTAFGVILESCYVEKMSGINFKNNAKVDIPIIFTNVKVWTI